MKILLNETQMKLCSTAYKARYATSDGRLTADTRAPPINLRSSIVSHVKSDAKKAARLVLLC